MKQIWLHFAAFLAMLVSLRAAAEQVWEYSPYQVQVWVALAVKPELTTRLEQRIARSIVWQADTADLAVWRVQASPAPSPLQYDMVHSLDAIAVEQIEKQSAEVLESDRLILVSVDVSNNGYQIQARQLSARYRAWGPVIRRTARQVETIPGAAFAAVRESFTPEVRIDHVQGKIVQARVRAGGLMQSPQSPAWVADDAIMLPLIRRTDRVGKLKEEGGIQSIPWTLMSVSSRAGVKLQCTIHSGMRAPISGRSSPRVEKVALVTKSKGKSTTLRLVSRGDSPNPLVGYQIHSLLPDSDASEFLGVTDWQGAIKVSQPDDSASQRTSNLRILYVKSGTRLLARLPLVPGLDPVVTAEVHNDDHRLGAESVITGLQNNFMDLIARRQVLASQIKSSIEAQQFDDAEQLIEKLRKIDTRNEFRDRLNQREQELKTDDQLAQKKIDVLFSDLRRLLGNHLDPQLANQLANELATARLNGKSTGG